MKHTSNDQHDDIEDNNEDGDRGGRTCALRQGPGIALGSTDAEGEGEW